MATHVPKDPLHFVPLQYEVPRGAAPARLGSRPSSVPLVFPIESLILNPACGNHRWPMCKSPDESSSSPTSSLSRSSSIDVFDETTTKGIEPSRYDINPTINVHDNAAVPEQRIPTAPSKKIKKGGRKVKGKAPAYLNTDSAEFTENVISTIRDDQGTNPFNVVNSSLVIDHNYGVSNLSESDGTKSIMVEPTMIPEPRDSREGFHQSLNDPAVQNADPNPFSSSPASFNHPLETSPSVDHGIKTEKMEDKPTYLPRSMMIPKAFPVIKVEEIDSYGTLPTIKPEIPLGMHSPADDASTFERKMQIENFLDLLKKEDKDNSDEKLSALPRHLLRSGISNIESPRSQSKELLFDGVGEKSKGVAPAEQVHRAPKGRMYSAV
ncbi:hypothetical protein BC829DRAFT_447712 [Chytridium lagenaria]|nr:hypothetical protein BC829DRAFT_447712 [Chytridium lagenaria]